ncbi:ABC transporter substrate-binding protein [Bradyrhizobium paxllaeri]|uniref:ABC transporter substrate-binding protein n=1 Tax=Bradyrhizobium paxllaeri TaxID=190148 RepID=UPI0008104616|nr:ABC transporter substrate-binding protein [Bradyrhizobium paxllaeri]
MKRSVIVAAAIAALVSIAGAQAEISNGVVKIGVLNDQSSLYADAAGPGSVLAAQMAVEDFGSIGPGIKIEVVSADHQNKPDVGSALTRRWLDVDGVDAILDVPNSGVALAVNEIVRGSRHAFLASSTASSDLTGKACSPNTVQWTFDTWSVANATVRSVTERGGSPWFFLTADYAFGYALERDATAAITANGAKVLGSVRHPTGTSDFSSFLLQAQSSKAKVIGLANAGGDTSVAIKQASEFGIPQGGQTMAALLVFVSDIHAIGLQTAQGLLFTEAFYWDLNDKTREWSKRFAARNKGKMPTMNHAGVYSSVLAYLGAVKATNSDDGAEAIAKMKEGAIDDSLFGRVVVRADGRAIHDMYLFQVKKPEESKGPWDYYSLVSTIPANQAFRPLDQGGCALVKK